MRGIVKRFLAIGVTGACGIVLAAGAQATNDGKILICHGTTSVDNPYVLISIDEHALAGHVLGEPGHGPNNFPDFVPPPDATDCSGHQ